MLQYTGARWVTINLPAIQDTRTLALNGISMLSAAEGWVAGARYTISPGGNTPSTALPLLLHYLNGAWSVAASQ